MPVDFGWLGLPLLDHVHHTSAEELLSALPDASVDLIATDPPYFKVKLDQAWDRQWDTAADFLSWMGDMLDQMRRVLKPNGSLYVFASPEMAWGVEGEVRQRFNVLNHLVWSKPSSRHNQTSEEELRTYFPQTERIIFAQSIDLDRTGLEAIRNDLDLFRPLRDYFSSERQKIENISLKEINQRMGLATNGGGMASNILTTDKVNWCFPAQETYELLASVTGICQRPYDDLRREYEDLRREYEELRRPFNVSADVPYTDVWTFPTVGYYDGKHPAEKPLAMMEHIIAASSRPGAVVLDPFCGYGTTLRAAKKLGRHYIGGDFDARCVAESRQRCDPVFGGHAVAALELTAPDLGPLFAALP